MLNASVELKVTSTSKVQETAKGWYWNMGKFYNKYAIKIFVMYWYWYTVHAHKLCSVPVHPQFSKWIHLKYCIKQSLHLKLCYLNWKWVESDRHFACYWYIWNTVQNRKVILLNYDIWNERSGQGQNITLTRSEWNSWFKLIQLI